MSAHRAQTRRRTRLWQAATVLLAVAAGGVLLLPIPDATGSGAVVAVNDTGPATRPIVPEPYQLDNTDRLGALMVKVNPRVEGAPPAATETPTEPIEPATPVVVEPDRSTPVLRSNWTFLGAAVTPRARRALVRIDQEQKFVREGAEIGGVRLVEVHDDHIMIEDQGVRRKVDKAPMTAEAGLSAPRGPSPALARTANAPDAARANPAPTSAAAKLADARAALGGPAASARVLARLHTMQPDHLLELTRTINDPSQPWDTRLAAVFELGMEPNMTIEERREVVRAIGLNPDDPDVLRLLEAEINGGKRDMR